MPPPKIRPLFTPTDQVVPKETGAVALIFAGTRIRKRIEETADSLRRLAPAASGEALERARRFLETFDQDSASREDLLRLWEPEQQALAATSEKMLALASSPHLTEVQEGLKSLVEEISNIQPSMPLWKRWFGGTPPLEDLKSNINLKIGEVRRKSDAIREKTPTLRVLRTEADVITQDVGAARLGIEAGMVAALRLREEFAASRPDLAAILDERASSLQTSMVIGGQSLLKLGIVRDRMIQLDQLLSNSLSNSLSNLVSAWSSNCSAALSRGWAADGVRSAGADFANSLRKLTGEQN